MRQGFGTVEMAADLTQMKADLTVRLTATGRIQRPTGAYNAAGDTVETYAYLTADANANKIYCFKEAMAPGDEAVFAGSLKGRQGFFIHMPAAQDVRLKDRWEMDAETGVQFEVVAVMDPITQEPLRKIVAVLIS